MTDHFNRDASRLLEYRSPEASLPAEAVHGPGGAVDRLNEAMVGTDVLLRQVQEVRRALKGLERALYVVPRLDRDDTSPFIKLAMTHTSELGSTLEELERDLT